MDLRIVHLLAEKKYKFKDKKIAENKKIISRWEESAGDGKKSYYYLVYADFSQELSDKLTDLTENENLCRVIITDAITSFPKNYEDEKQEEEREKISFFKKISREELREDVMGGSAFTADFLALVFISAIVATIGMMSDNIAIVIGAMVITPLLGPNMALGVATALGDLKLIIRSAITGMSGVIISILIAYITAHLIPMKEYNEVMKMVSEISYASIALALCAGLAATIYALQGASSGLVGVMVAVALLPPAANTGIALAEGYNDVALRSAMVLCVNIVCFNLAVKLLLLTVGITPRTKDRKEKDTAKKAMIIYISFWLVSLAILTYGISYLDVMGSLKK